MSMSMPSKLYRFRIGTMVATKRSATALDRHRAGRHHQCRHQRKPSTSGTHVGPSAHDRDGRHPHRGVHTRNIKDS
jgi:hypothetical protein